MGLKPGNTDGTYIQKVPLIGITPAPAPLVFKNDSQHATLKWKDEVVAWTKHVADSAAIDDSEMVFVGYGTVAPEYSWDDYKGVDVKGKTLVMLVNDPPVPDPSNPSELDPKTFGGRAMTYYGRWTYKYEIGAEKGAAGVLLIHETGPAGYPFDVVQSKTAEQFDLVTPDKNMGRVAVEGWITLDQGKNLLKMAGQDFDALKMQAATREFQPVPLGVRASMTIKNTLRQVDSKNVLAKYKGQDPVLKHEYVVYTRALGPSGHRSGGKQRSDLQRREGQRVRDGRPAGDRSRIHEAADCAEAVGPVSGRHGRGAGAAGSQYYTVKPVYPLAKTVANINMDVLNVHGRTKDLTLVGLGASDLDDYARDAAAEQGRIIRGDPEPEKGYYYRSDHFNFAKQGVPALDPDEGLEYIGKPPEFGEKVRADYTDRDYHQPSDIVRADWDLAGAREDLKVFFAVGYRVAEADVIPAWKPGNEFKAKRDEMLKAS